MYFDEVLWASAAGQFLNGVEVDEWTHPPLAKEVIAASLRAFAGFRAETARAPRALRSPRLVAGTADDLAWVDRDGMVARGRIDGDCRLRVASRADPGLEPTALARTRGRTLVAGTSESAPVLAELDDARPPQRVGLPGRAVSTGRLGDASFVVTEQGELVRIADGRAEPVADGIRAVWFGRDTLWTGDAARTVATRDSSGRVTWHGSLRGVPDAITEPTFTDALADRIAIVSESGGRRIERIVPSRPTSVRVSAVRTRLLSSASGSGLVWASSGASMVAIEPFGRTVLASLALSGPAVGLVPDPDARRMIAVGDDFVTCAYGQPAFAWRLPGVVASAATAALVALLAMRLTGSVRASVVAATLIGLDSLGFAVSRCAKNDPVVTMLVVAAWLCGVSTAGALLRRARRSAAAWTFATIVASGAAVSTSWVGAFPIAGVVAVVTFAIARSARGRWVRRGVGWTAALAVGVVSAYLLSYRPYLGGGHSFGELLGLQWRMLRFHALSREGHWFASGWYSWLLGLGGMYVFLSQTTAGRDERWLQPNAVIMVGGVLAMAVLGRSAVRLRRLDLAVPPVAAFSQLAPVAATPIGTSYVYHAVPLVPFLAIGLACACGRRRVLTAVVIGAAAAYFAVLLPIVSGLPVDPAYHRWIGRAMPWLFSNPLP